MRTIKKIIYVLTVVMLIALCGVMAACKKEHVHSYASEWNSDENYHWHEPLCDDAERILQAHKFKDGKCEVCGREKDVPGEEEPGENEPSEEEPGEEEPGEKEPSEEEPSEKEPGEKEPGGEEPGEKEPGEKDPSEEDPTAIKKELSEYFEGVEFGELLLESDKDEAYELAAKAERMFESGKGFVGGDMVIESVSGNSIFGTGQQWRINNIGTSIDEAPEDLRVYSEEYISSTDYYGAATKTFSGRYADMTSAYGIVTAESSAVQKYSVRGAAKYLAREGIDNAVYIVDRIAVLLEDDATTKKFRKDGDKFYLNLTVDANISYGWTYMTIKTTVNVVFYDGLLLALDYSETDNYSGGTNYYRVYSTVFDNDIAMPKDNVTTAQSVPEWLSVPHVGALDEDKIFSDADMIELKEEADRDKLTDMCNKFYYSIYYTQGGMYYVGAHGDLDIEMSMSGMKSEITVDRTSSLNYLIHKKTSNGNTLVSEQYLDGEYLYERIADSDEANSKEKTRKFEDEYSEDYLEFINGELCEQLLFAMTTYYGAVSNPSGEPEGPTNIPPSQIQKFIPEGFTVKYKQVEDLIVYKIRLSDIEENAEDKSGCTDMAGYYVYDASGKLYAVKFTYTVYGFEKEDQPEVAEMKLLIGEHSVTVPEEFEKFGEATEDEEPYMDF